MFSGIFTTGIQTLPGGLVVALFGASAVTLTVAYTFRSVKIIFFGPMSPALANHKIQDPPLTMCIPLLLIAGVSVTLGVYPKLVINFFHFVLGGMSIP